jgi:hypothetical protein
MHVSRRSEAKRYKTLVDAPVIGKVTELSRDTGPNRNVRYTGDLYTSSIDGATVRNTQVQPVGWWSGVRVLEEIRKNAG